MKKLMNIALCIIMVVCSFGVHASNVTVSGISQIGEPDADFGQNYYFIGIDGRTSAEKNAIGEDGFAFLLNVFSDENMMCVKSDITELINSENEDYPAESVLFRFYTTDSVQYDVRFNSEKILITVINADEMTLKQGLFKFKDSSLYEEVMLKYNEWENGQKETAEDLKRNKVEITDFKSIYHAEFDTKQYKDFGWGMCSYKKAGEAETTTALYYILMWFDEYKLIVVSENMPENNTFEITGLRFIELDGENAVSGEEYDATDGTFTFKFQVNVNEDMTVGGLLVTRDEVTDCADMSTYRETGTLPSEYFEAADNINEAEGGNVDVGEAENGEEKVSEEEIKETSQTPEQTEPETAQREDKKESAFEEEKPVNDESEKSEEEETSGETESDDVEKAEDEDETEINLDYDFIDVPESHWAYDEIYSFAEQKIVLGYGNGYFGVNDYVTYEHFALLLERLFGYSADNRGRVPAIREDVIVSVVKALDLDVSSADISILDKKFSDCSNIENKKYIAAAIEAGLVIGSYGRLYPENNLTRAETVVLLSRAVNFK